jgi:bifunctional DNase/RNase
MLIPFKIQNLMLDPVSRMPVVVLRAEEDQRILPIWIGEFEANAIAMRLEDVSPPRPMTHDLLSATVLGLGATVQMVVVSQLVESTFHAEIHLRLSGGEAVVLDSRPSDALALALRLQAPVLVASEVLDSVREGREGAGSTSAEGPNLEEIDPDLLGKYTM